MNDDEEKWKTEARIKSNFKKTLKIEASKAKNKKIIRETRGEKNEKINEYTYDRHDANGRMWTKDR